LKYGYARVSTRDQSARLQRDALAGHGVDEIVEETASAQGRRPALEALVGRLSAGDILVVWRLDRLGRSARDLLALEERIRERGAGFVSLSESIDASTASGKMLFAVLSAVAQMERDVIVERTLAGLEAAKKRGRVGGRRRVDGERLGIAMRMHASGEFSVAQTAAASGVGKSTLYKYLKEARESGEDGPSSPGLRNA
jgi:DNA invertase Pin-like site-specific DNA recombinase